MPSITPVPAPPASPPLIGLLASITPYKGLENWQNPEAVVTYSPEGCNQDGAPDNPCTPTSITYSSRPETVTWKPYCVDEETRILTIEGWKSYDQLESGNLVLTLNHSTGLAEWQPVESVHVFPAEERELIRMEGLTHSSLTTPNHRWAVESQTRSLDYGRQLVWERVWRTTEELGNRDRIPIAAFNGDLPVEAKYTDSFVELVAWYWTEGDKPFARRSDGVMRKRGPRITQALKNESNVDRIDATLRRVFGGPLEKIRCAEPAWKRTINEGRLVRFKLNLAAGEELFAVAPNRVVDFEFLRSLTQAQLRLFIEVSLLADNAGPTSLAQRDQAAAESFQFACILAGFGSSLRYREKGDMWHVRIHQKSRVSPASTSARNVKKGNKAGLVIERVTHSGIVWCPKTANSTWYASRKGTVYFTGNTLKVTEKCSSLGTEVAEEGEPRVRRLMLADTERQLGAEFWDGALAQADADYADNTWLANVADVDILTESGPVTLSHGMACLDQYLASNNSGQQGAIHATIQTLNQWVTLRVVERINGKWYSPGENLVIPSPGYSGTSPDGAIGDNNVWAYATDMPRIFLDKVQTFPLMKTIDRRNNTIQVQAQRMALVEYQRCRHGGVRLAQEICDSGGS